jgi:hypothetical protein
MSVDVEVLPGSEGLEAVTWRQIVNSSSKYLPECYRKLILSISPSTIPGRKPWPDDEELESHLFLSFGESLTLTLYVEDADGSDLRSIIAGYERYLTEDDSKRFGRSLRFISRTYEFSTKLGRERGELAVQLALSIGSAELLQGWILFKSDLPEYRVTTGLYSVATFKSRIFGK